MILNVKIICDALTRNATAWCDIISNTVRSEGCVHLCLDYLWYSVEVGIKIREKMLLKLLSVSEINVCLRIDSYIKNTVGETSHDVCSALLTSYSVDGNVTMANLLYKRTAKISLCVWGSNIAFFAAHKCQASVRKFVEMERLGDIRPDKGVFTSVLIACGYSGMVTEGVDILMKMIFNYKMERNKQIYIDAGSMITFVGPFEELFRLSEELKASAAQVMDIAILNICYKHRETLDVVLWAEHAWTKLSEKSSRDYASLANVYAYANRFEDSQLIWEIICYKRKGKNRERH